MAGRSKVEAALYESYVKGQLNRPVKPQPGRMGLTQSIQIRNNGDDGGASQLVKALSQLAPELAQTLNQFDQRDMVTQRTEAERNYMSMTLDERKSMIEGGQLSGKDPVYQAMFSRLWGEDVARQSRDDVLTQIQTGNLKFSTSEELNKFMQDRRQHDLTNWQGNEYALAGYDTHYNQTLQEASRINSLMRGKERRDYDLTLSGNQLKAVAEESGGNPAALQKTYQAVQLSGNFTDTELHHQLTDVAQTLARKGDMRGLEAVLTTQFSADEKFDNLGTFMGDASEALRKTAKAVDLEKRRDRFEETYTNLRDAAHKGNLTRFMGTKSANPETFYKWLEGKGGRDLLEPTQIASILQMNENAIERQRREAEARAQKAAIANMRAQMQQFAYGQALQYGRAGVSDQTYVDANGQVHVMSADTMYNQAALQFNQNVAAEVKAGKKKPEEGFRDLLTFYGKGGTNPEWKDQLSYGVSAFGLLASQPQDENAKTVAMNALNVYERLKGSSVNGMAERHTTPESRKLLEAGLVARRMGLDPVTVISRYMANPTPPQSIPMKQFKGIPDNRLKEAMDFANVVMVGTGKSPTDAVAEAKRYVNDYSININGNTAYPLTREATLQAQQEATQRLLGQFVKALPSRGLTDSDLIVSQPTNAAGYYEVRVKGANSVLRDDKGFPVVISKADLLKEIAAENERQIVRKSNRAVGKATPPDPYKLDAEIWGTVKQN